MRSVSIAEMLRNLEDQKEYVRRCESAYQAEIGAAVKSVLRCGGQKRFLALSGPSGSGKTSSAYRIRDALEKQGVKVCLIGMDNFFYGQKDLPPETNGDWESPYCVNAELLLECMERLAAGETVSLPQFNFHASAPGGVTEMQGSSEAVILVEGIHMLHPRIFDRIRERAAGVYVSPCADIITEKGERIPPEQLRVLRRLVRDHRVRGHGLRRTVEYAANVDRGERLYIAPFRENASVRIDTFHAYELCALAGCLKEIGSFREELPEEFMTQHGFSALMEAVESMPSPELGSVPENSVIREFIGGSCYPC